MFKIVYCVRRKPGTSVEAFQDYWLNSHGPLVRSHAEALKIRRYVQTHTVHAGLTEAMVKSRGAPEPFDGIAEVWYDSEADVFAATKTPEGRAAGKALIEDEMRFIDGAASVVFAGVEHAVVGEDT